MDSIYRITSIEVNLLSFSNGFNIQTPCFNSNPSLNIRIGCEGEFIHSNVLFEDFNILGITYLKLFIAELNLSTNKLLDGILIWKAHKKNKFSVDIKSICEAKITVELVHSSFLTLLLVAKENSFIHSFLSIFQHSIE